MGQKKTFSYRKILSDFEELRYREARLYAERVTAVYGGGVTSTGEWTPAVDVFETADSLYLVAELPGVSENDISLEASDDLLTLRGRKPFPRRGIPPESYLRMECPSGGFERSFHLPFAVEESKVKAVLRDGLLTVSLSRRKSGRK